MINRSIVLRKIKGICFSKYLPQDADNQSSPRQEYNCELTRRECYALDVGQTQHQRSRRFLLHWVYLQRLVHHRDLCQVYSFIRQPPPETNISFFRCFSNSVCQPCFFAFKWLSAQKRLLQNIQTQVLPDEDVGEDNDEDFGKLVVAQAMGDLSHELRKLWKLIHLNRHKKLSIKTESVINWNLQKAQKKYNKEFDIGHEFPVEEKN